MSDNNQFIDSTRPIREGEELPLDKLAVYFADHISGFSGPLTATQFPGGHSNLTYLIKDGNGREMVLRRPPRGAKIATAHDMGREFRILSLVHPHFKQVPEPLAYDEEGTVLGVPFYVMERVSGLILRSNRLPKGLSLTETEMRAVCNSAVDTLAGIHSIDVSSGGLAELGKPEGYVERQVSGWTKRYFDAKTDEVPQIEKAAKWLATNMPPESGVALIHNDYKYDNLVLDADKVDRVLAVLDWEMATVGDPMMDLGTALGYWIDADDPDEMQMMPLGPTTVPGNLNRLEVAQRYCEATGRSTDHLLFYYVFGLFKIAVIAQQIYARYKKGFSKDERFATMIFGVNLLGQQAERALDTGRIDSLG